MNTFKGAITFSVFIRGLGKEGMVKNCAMEKAKCEIWQEHQKSAPTALLV